MRGWIILALIFLIGLSAVSFVSAGENVTGDVLGADEVISNFTELNRTINANDDSVVNLTGNYAFAVDEDFIEGIRIDRAVTVNGNGHTISGEGFSRIFDVNNINVVFKNIIFTNGKTETSGGAINGNCHAVNCTFTNNHAKNSGGAMYSGTATDCTFIANQAEFGGAICAASATNCTFTNNKADYLGGAMQGIGYTARNCTFTNNTANYCGGAISQCSASECSFTDNRAMWGGAIYYGSATGSVFTNNYANISGGAIYLTEGLHDITILSCNFTNCSSNGNGGAIANMGENNNILSCNFENCFSNATGGGVYNKNASTNMVDCNFKGNVAKEYPDYYGSSNKNTANPAPVKEKVTSAPVKNTCSLILKKVKVKKSAKKLILTATLKINKKAVKGKIITFKFNRKTYKTKTNKNGVAKVVVKKSVLKKLKVGKKLTYTATYAKKTVKKTVKVLR